MANTPMNQPSRFVDWDEIINAIETPLRNDKSIQKQLLAMAGGIPDVVYYRECCTVIAGAGRQNGKTEWIVMYADEDTLILTDNAITKYEIERRLSEGQPIGVPLPIVRSRNETAPYPDKVFTNVMVDSASYVFRHWDINKFYKNMLPHVTTKTMFYLIG